MNKISNTQDKLTINNNGKLVSKLVPYKKRLATPFGAHQGVLKSQDDCTEPTGEPWDAET